MEQYIGISASVNPEPYCDGAYFDGTELHVTSNFGLEYDVYTFDSRENSFWRYDGTTSSGVMPYEHDGAYLKICAENTQVCTYVRLIKVDYSFNESGDWNFEGYNLASLLPMIFERASEEGSNLNVLMHAFGMPLKEISNDIMELRKAREGSLIKWSDPDISMAYIYSGDVTSMTATEGETEIELSRGLLDSVEPTRYTLHDSYDTPFVVSGNRIFNKYVNDGTVMSEYIFYFDASRSAIVGLTKERGNIRTIWRVFDSFTGLGITDYLGFDVVDNDVFVLSERGLYHFEVPNKSRADIYAKLIPVVTSGVGLKIVPNGFVNWSDAADLYIARFDYYDIIDNVIYVLDKFDSITLNGSAIDCEDTLLWNYYDDICQMFGLFRSNGERSGPHYVESIRAMSSNVFHDEDSIQRLMYAHNISAEIEPFTDFHDATSVASVDSTVNGDKLVEFADFDSYSGEDAISFQRSSDSEIDGAVGLVGVYDLGNKVPKAVYFDGTNEILLNDTYEEESVESASIKYLLLRPSLHGVFPYGDEKYLRVPVGDENKWCIVYNTHIVSGVDLTGKTASYYSDSYTEDELTSVATTIDFGELTINCYYSELTSEFSSNMHINDRLYFVDSDTVLYSFNTDTLLITFSRETSCTVRYSTDESNFVDSNNTDMADGLPWCILVPEVDPSDYIVSIAEMHDEDHIYIFANVENDTGVAICDADIRVELDGVVTTYQFRIAGSPFVLPKTDGHYVVKVFVTGGLEYDVMPSSGIEFDIADEDTTEYDYTYVGLEVDVL